MISILIPTDIAGSVSEQLGGRVEDVIALDTPTAHQMYHATWHTDDGALPIVIRFYATPRGDEEARVETAALRGLLKADYAVPDLYLCADVPEVGSTPFIVMQRLPGRPLGELALDYPDQIGAWVEQASALMVRLHSINWQTGFDFFQPPMSVLEFAERQLKWWSIQAQKSGATRAAAGFAWLKLNVYRARDCAQQALVHRDFHPNNLMASGDHITGVVDWGELTIADPAVDVAWTRMVLATEVDAALADAFCAAYLRRHPDVSDTLQFWEVLSACKRLTALASHRTRSGLQVGAGLEDSITAFMQARLSDDE
jgi:aminoglycoside phosphotransferase (APT) family kinase protein